MSELRIQLVETAKKWVDAKLRASEYEAEMKRLSERVAEEDAEAVKNGGGIAARIREVRELRCLSQRELGERIGANQAVISQIEEQLAQAVAGGAGQIATVLKTSFDTGDVDGSRTRTLSTLELKIVNAMAANRGVPLTIALVADRASATTAECSDALDDLVDEGLVAMVMGGFVLVEHANKGGSVKLQDAKADDAFMRAFEKPKEPNVADAMATVCHVLAPLDKESQWRVLRAAAILLGVKGGIAP